VRGIFRPLARIRRIEAASGLSGANEDAAASLAMLPGMGGTVVVALTGWGQQSDRQRACQAGFHDHLVKPASIESLAALFARLAAPPEESPGE
jgi:CheY-like chemotaxis protein